MIITGTNLITGSLAIEYANPLYKGTVSEVIFPGKSYTVPDYLRFTPDVIHAVTTGLITISLQPTDESVQEDTPPLPANVTTQGNTFNGPSLELVQTNSASQIAAANTKFLTTVACIQLLGGL